jgi:hypothetical protein
LDIKKNNDRSNEIIHLIKISEARAWYIIIIIIIIIIM